MLPWLQRRWRTGQLRSIDGGGLVAGQFMCCELALIYRNECTKFGGRVAPTPASTASLSLC